MTAFTNDKKTSEYMRTLRTDVAEQDAAQDAQLAAIMVRKPARPRKVEPEPTWLADQAAKVIKPGAGKAKAKKARKAKP